MLILLSSLFAVMVIIILYQSYRLINLKSELRIFNQQFLKLQSHYSVLQTENINFIKRIEQLSSQVTSQEKLIADSSKIQEQFFSFAKSALFDLGSDLSRNLIEVHKKETMESRLLSEHNIDKTSRKFTNELNRIIEIVSNLNRDIESSKNTVDIIKTSLLSPSTCGKLAEITLENILKSSGLRTGTDFIIQYNIVGENQCKLRPDAVVFLPCNNLMVLDAKASKFLLDDIDSTNLSKTMNTHLKSLQKKDYAENIIKNLEDNLSAKVKNIITIMFLPTEHAVDKIMAADPSFINKSWQCNIFPVGPTGLMNMLSLAKFQISEHLMSINNEKIITEIKKILSSIKIMSEHSNRLGINIQNLCSNYDKFAASFNHNFLSKANNIKKLGIDSNDNKKYQVVTRYDLTVNKTQNLNVEDHTLDKKIILDKND
ncbi:DNA recombination protein RmuC [Rickettsia endosymbiont of Cardiosporidium cionae]|uniref:DNA recombination protein RmuC n=1 Tax=Rickettsia endosymbiont of Cardiosporidium cionae TaxID=2777155 RepID=UPI0018947239|nr:DNA recombination protein RmuC [Rickettsia endosymbiont of Cardiosporidium cionae]KAF8818431.1 DNA recombination protein RmuC [Rickettsia endosymbiont of Cardiosporidium cionae]